MEDIHIEALRRKATAGDDTAICPLLLALGADPAMVKRIATKLHTGRDLRRDPAAFEQRVNAIMHYTKRGWYGISKKKRIEEIIEKFQRLKPNVVNHIANGQGYQAEREEAKRRIRAEADDTESNF